MSCGRTPACHVVRSRRERIALRAELSYDDIRRGDIILVVGDDPLGCTFGEVYWHDGSDLYSDLTPISRERFREWCDLLATRIRR